MPHAGVPKGHEADSGISSVEGYVDRSRAPSINDSQRRERLVAKLRGRRGRDNSRGGSGSYGVESSGDRV